MKRATLTPNRFITYTPNWWVNGFVLFTFFFLLDGCVDETSLIGFKKEPRMEVRFKEFDIPAVTVQADSISSQNVRSSSIGDRWLCGITDNSIDPYFGKVNATIFTKLRPGGKLYPYGRSGFTLTKATLNLVLDYYVYGDTLNSESTFTLHEITDAGFNFNTKHFTNSSLSYDPTPITSGTYEFKYDSIKKYIALRNDNTAGNEVYDTLNFDLGINGTFVKALFDTTHSKGLYIKRKASNGVSDTLVYSSYRTDSVFHKAFKGLAIVPQSGNRVLGFTSKINSAITSSRLSLYFSYYDSTDQIIKNGQFNYYFQDASHYQDIPNFSKIVYDRASTNLSGLSPANKFTNYNSPDGYCYAQSGTGLYTKLDFTAVMDTFDAYKKISFNSVELVIPVDPLTTRPQIKIPSGLYVSIINSNNRFFNIPLIPTASSSGPTLSPEPIYTSGYYSQYNYNDGNLLLRDDANLNYLVVEYQTRDNVPYYRGYLTQFMEYHKRRLTNVPRSNSLALVPATYFGKSLSGVSFKNDQIKLRVYYSVPK